MEEFEENHLSIYEGMDVGLAVFKQVKGDTLPLDFYTDKLKAYDDDEMIGKDLLIAGYPTEVGEEDGDE